MITVIAEAGVNHNGDPNLAVELIDAAAAAGADVVKFQTFVPTELVSRHLEMADYQKTNTASTQSMLEMVASLRLDEATHRQLMEHCRHRGIGFMSTPFDLPSIRLLTDLGVDTLKIGSGELTNPVLLLAAARTGKPIILSTGMSTIDEVEDALGVLAFGYQPADEPPSTAAFAAAWRDTAARTAVVRNVTLLHCTTEYPAPFADVNLRAMDTLAATFHTKVGYSDHTPGITIPIAAAARGASVIEKHFTTDRRLPGPDHRASLEPGELKAMVDAIRAVEVALGHGVKVPAASEIKNTRLARKCLVADTIIRAGEPFSDTNLAVKRGGGTVPPSRYWDLLGQHASRDYQPDDAIVP